MAYLKGENVNIGFARETVRGTAEAPSIWVPARTPAGMQAQVQKAEIKETTGSGMGSTGAVVVEKRAEGEVEVNIRSSSFGMLLLSLLGSVATTAPQTGAYQHILNILTGNPQFPTLTAGLAQLGMQDYQYAKCLVTELAIRTPLDDLANATASLISTAETTIADYTVAFPADDYYFRPQDITIKIASNVAGLAAASAIAWKEFSLDIKNNGRTNRTGADGLTPSDVFGLMTEVNGSLKLDYQDETYHDILAAGTAKALRITMLRSDVTIGTSLNPKIEIDLPLITAEGRNQDRPMDDIVSDSIDFTARYSTADGYGIRATVVNTFASYA